MPAISLVICLYKECDLLERLLKHADGCYDDLVVVHDGPEFDKDVPPPVTVPPREMAIDYAECPSDTPPPSFYKTPPLLIPSPGTQELVLRHGGRYFEGIRCYQQEPHWPFAWWQAKHDWILRLDADEYPSTELKQWLRNFRSSAEPPSGVSGYTGLWPLWNGKRAVIGKWPDGRNFLFHRWRIRFTGVVEMVPQPESHFEPLPFALEHVPRRKSFGYRNLLLRKQAYRWRHIVAASLLGSPKLLPRWRWQTDTWPEPFNQIVEHPYRYMFKCLFRYPFSALRTLLKHRLYGVLYSFPGSHWHHALICWEYIRLKRKRN